MSESPRTSSGSAVTRARMLAAASQLLRRRALLMDAEVVVQAAEALRTHGACGTLEALLDEALRRLLALDRPQTCEDSPLAWRYAFLEELLGLTFGECVAAGSAFNACPERERRAFFELLLARELGVEPWRREQPGWQQDVLAALTALGLTPRSAASTPSSDREPPTPAPATETTPMLP